MGSRRLAAVAATAIACVLAASPAMAAVPAAATMPSPAPRLMPAERMDLSTRSAPDVRMSRAAVADMLLTLAWNLRGIPYRWGGHDPDRGFDCSGLVRYVFEHALGVLLPHRARLQFDRGRQVPRDQLEPGDLVFFRTNGRSITHVGIYIDHGRFLNAPNSGEVVQVDSLHNPYWSSHFAGARRLVEVARG